MPKIHRKQKIIFQTGTGQKLEAFDTFPGYSFLEII